MYLCGMKRIVTHLLLLLIIKDEKKVKGILDILYGNDIPQTEKKGKTTIVREPARNQSKRDEIIDAINYIKSKPRKTKADKDKLHLLEVVLKSV